MSRPVHIKDGLNYSGSGGGSNNHLTDKMVAEYESTSTATHAYEVGGQFIYKGKLYTAITDIAEGDSILPPGDIVSNITLQGSTVISKVIVDDTEYINHENENSIPVRAGSAVSLYSNYPMYYSDDSHDSSGTFLSNTACHFIVPNNASGDVNLYVDLKNENKLLLQFYNNRGVYGTNGWLLDVTPVGGEGTSQFNCILSDSLTEQIAKKGSADNFIGTKEQWEALTPQEQAKYKTMDFIGDSIGGGGHTILNEQGTEMPQRSKLQFNGATVTDDAQNDITDIDIEAESGEDISYADYQQLTPEQQANGDYYIPDYPDQPGYADNAPRAGSQAYVTSDGLNNIIGTADISGIGTTLKGAIANLGTGIHYSTDEQWTGKYWIDGKKIYQKTYHGTLGNTAIFIVDSNITRARGYQLLKYEGYANTGSVITTIMPWYFSSTNFLQPALDDRGMTINMASGYYGSEYSLTIQYTKTTD